MRQRSKTHFATAARAGSAALLIALASATPALAGKVSWLDDVVREVLVEAKSGGKAEARGATRLFAARAREPRSPRPPGDSLARSARAAEAPTEALLRTRFGRLVRADGEMTRAFAALAPAERRVVVEMGEAAQQLARRYPGQAEKMVRSLGTEGLSAVRVYGDDVAEVVVKEGPEALGVLRKTGRGAGRSSRPRSCPTRRSWPPPAS